MSTTTANPPAAAAATKGTREKRANFVVFFFSFSLVESESNPSPSSAANFCVSLPPPLERKSGTRTANLNDTVLFARVCRGECSQSRSRRSFPRRFPSGRRFFFFFFSQLWLWGAIDRTFPGKKKTAASLLEAFGFQSSFFLSIQTRIFFANAD